MLGDVFGQLSNPARPYLCGLIKCCTLLPWGHAPWQGEQDTPILDDQLRHKGHLNEDSRTRRQITHTDGEHVLR